MYFCKQIFALAICMVVAKQIDCFKSFQRIASPLVHFDGQFGKLQCIKECLLRKRCAIMGYNRKYLSCQHGEDQETVPDGDALSVTAFRSEILQYEDILGQCAYHNCPTGQRCIKSRSTYLCVDDWCKDSWVYYRKHCYYFSSHATTWNGAKDECIGMNSSLVKVDDQMENELIRSHIPETIAFVWLGATDVAQEGTWIWEADSSPVVFSRWSNGAPDNYGNSEHCMVIMSDRKWGDIPCSNLNRFICEKY